MYTKTWKPGEDQELDQIFENYREQQYSNYDDPLRLNYSKKAISQCQALSITFDHSGNPLVLSGILRRPIWPNNTFRICNRFWKVKEERLIAVDKSTGLHIVSKAIQDQTTYAKEYLNAELIFLSRQYDNWQKFVVKQVRKHTGLEFQYDNYKYLTCDNLEDSSCWQKIIYLGNDTLLNSWLRK